MVFNACHMEINRKVVLLREADKEVTRAFMREASIRSRPITEKILRLCWTPSSTHRFTLNVDGSVKGTMRVAGIGRILKSVEDTGVVRIGTFPFVLYFVNRIEAQTPLPFWVPLKGW
nr:hypothetical protein [Ipomoea batatas]